MTNTKSLSLNGTTNAFSMAEHTDFDDTSNFTVGAWVKTTATSTDVIMQNYDRTGAPVRYGWYFAMLSGGNIRIQINHGSGESNTQHNGSVKINDGAWHFVVATFDTTANLLAVYIDGKADGTSSATSDPVYGTTYPRVGCLYSTDTGSNNNFWAGELDGVFYLSGVTWDVDDVNTYMYKNLATEGVSGLVAYYDMEDDITDTSGSATSHDGTQIGTVAYSTSVPYVDTVTEITATDSNRIEDNNATTNYSANAYFQVGEYNGGAFVDRSLLHFDLSSIPSDATINQVRMKVWDDGSNYSSNTRTMRVYRMVRAWTASTSTWNTTDGSTSWGTAGASNVTDREATDIGTISMPATEVEGYKFIDLTASAVQDWLDGTLTNNGIQLKMDTETNDMHQFSDETVSGEEPKLIVDYTSSSRRIFVIS